MSLKHFVIGSTLMFIWAPLHATAQNAKPSLDVVDVSASEILKILQLAPPDGVSDQQIRVGDMGKYNVAIGVLHRSPKAKQNASAHAHISEVYVVLEGSGTLVTGGRIPDANPLPSDGELTTVALGPTVQGSSIVGGSSRQLGPGDVVVIPPTVPHWFRSVASDMKYLIVRIVRIDGDHVLPSGYVNPALK